MNIINISVWLKNKNFPLNEAVCYAFFSLGKHIVSWILFYFIQVCYLLMIGPLLFLSKTLLALSKNNSMSFLVMLIVSLFVLVLTYRVMVLAPILSGFHFYKTGEVVWLGQAFDKKVLQIIMLSVFQLTIALLGFVCFIIPGFFFLGRFWFAIFFMLDKNMSVLDAMQASWCFMRGKTLPLIVFLVPVLIVVSPAISFLIQPFYALMCVYLYKKGTEVGII